MNDTEAECRFRDRSVDLTAILDHLSLCLLIARHHEAECLRSSIERALQEALAVAEDDSSASRH